VGRFDVGAAAPAVCQSPAPGSVVPLGNKWTDTSVADGGNYFYVVYADNGYFCTPTASGTVVTKVTPGKATGSIEVLAHDTENVSSGQYDVQISDLATIGHGYPDTVFQYQLGSGPWVTVVDGDWITSMADSSVYGNPITVTLRACRDAVGGFCGESSVPTTVTPVNARAGITSCAAGQKTVPSAPKNPGARTTPVVTYTYLYEDALGIWVDTGDDVAPIGTQAVRVKATVQIGPAPYYTDPAYGEGPCTP
jgi:large repetitive protein